MPDFPPPLDPSRRVMPDRLATADRLVGPRLFAWESDKSQPHNPPEKISKADGVAPAAIRPPAAFDWG